MYSKDYLSTLESRLKKHVEESGFAEIYSDVGLTSPWQIVLLGQKFRQPKIVSNFFRSYSDYALNGKFSEWLSSLSKKYGENEDPKTWQEMIENLIPFLKDQERLGNIEYSHGIYLSPKRLVPYKESGKFSNQEKKIINFPKNDRLIVIDGNIPISEAKLIVELHESIHARDYNLGFLLGDYSKKEVQTIEMLTEIRSVLFGMHLFPGYFSSENEPEENWISKVVEPITLANMEFLKDLKNRYDLDMQKILKNLSGLPLIKNNQPILEKLIIAENNTDLPLVIPEDLI